jgi:hypothetical protein
LHGQTKNCVLICSDKNFVIRKEPILVAKEQLFGNLGKEGAAAAAG